MLIIPIKVKYDKEKQSIHTNTKAFLVSISLRKVLAKQYPNMAPTLAEIFTLDFLLLKCLFVTIRTNKNLYNNPAKIYPVITIHITMIQNFL